MDFLENAKFDCVVIGTGMSESLIASALCLNGKSVLHMDHNDFYGGSTSSGNLEQSLKRWLPAPSEQANDAIPSTNAPELAKIVTDLSELGVTVREEDLSLVPLQSSAAVRVVAASDRAGGTDGIVGTTRSARSFHPAVFDYTMERTAGGEGAAGDHCASALHPAFIGYRRDKTMTAGRAFHLNRHFSIDESPRLLLSYGKMVDAMLTSGVNSYMEFVSIEAIYIARPGKPSGAASAVELVAVPCSKADVFKSKLLTGLEKRTIMKLLQLAVDYGNALKGVDATYQNESTLVQGRALHRPQNTHEDRGAGTAAVISEEALKDKTFSQFLSENGIPPHLQDIVMYAMCLCRSRDCTAADGLDFLYRHIYASGRLGETAFLYPIYGTTEVPESFCRSAAVRGAVYALRQNVVGLVVSESPPVITAAAAAEEEPQGASESEAKAPPCDEATPLDNKVVEPVVRPVVAVVLSGGKVMACDKLVLSASNFRSSLPREETMATRTGAQCLVTRVSVCVGDQLLGVGRGIGVLPPNTGALGNLYPVFVLQLNSSAMVCPQGCFLLYIMTLIDGNMEDTQDDSVASVMDRVASYVQSMSEPAKEYREIYYHVKMSDYTTRSPGDAVNDLGLRSDRSSASGAGREPSNVGIGRSCREAHSMVMDEAVSHAKQLFDRIYPDEGFFTGPIVSSAVAEETDEEARLLDL